MARPLLLLLLVASLALAACGGSASTDAGSGADGGPRSDAGPGMDGGPRTDAGPGADAGPGTDAGTGTDAGPGTDAGAAPLHWVTAYYVGYQRDLLPPDAVDFTSITHLAISPYVPSADGSLDTTIDIDPTTGPTVAHDLATRAHAAGRKVILMIGGAGAHDGFAAAAGSGTRATFVANLMAVATTVGADGLDLDWEPLDPADQADFMALATAIRAAWPTVILTVPLGYVNSNFPTVDAFYATVAPLFDQMNLMTYGMSGDWSGWDSWHSSALMGEGGSTPTSVTSSIDAYVAAGVPAAKLGIGIGFYGQCWRGITAPHQPLASVTYVADDNTMSFRHIMEGYPAGGRMYDAAANAAYLSYSPATGSPACSYVSYENETSIAAKGAYVGSAHLGGTIIWTVNQGRLTDGTQPVLDAVRHAFLE